MSANGQIKRYRRWLGAARAFGWDLPHGVTVTVRRDHTGLWAVLREVPGCWPQVWDGQRWAAASEHWSGEHAQDTALGLVDAAMAHEIAEHERLRAMLAAAVPVEEHLAEHASDRKGAAA
jgi:hypothetical protein